VNCRIWIIAITLAAMNLFGNKFCHAEDFKIDLNTLFEQACKKSPQAGQNTFVWWFPRQWWQANLAQYPVVQKEDLPRVLKLLEANNMIFAVRSQETGEYGALIYKDKEEIRKTLRLKDAQGNIYKPLADEEVNLEVRNFLNKMRPALAERVVALGQDIYFFVFPGKNDAGEEIALAKNPGRFSVSLADEEFSWQLPLPALFPPKACPLCKRELKSDYRYCPYDGTRLPEEVQK